jgi:hypothetical protein
MQFDAVRSKGAIVHLVIEAEPPLKTGKTGGSFDRTLTLGDGKIRQAYSAGGNDLEK